MKNLIRSMLTMLVVMVLCSFVLPAYALSPKEPDLVLIKKPAGIYVRNQGTASTKNRFVVDLYLTELATPSQKVTINVPIAPNKDVLVIKSENLLLVTAVCPKVVADSTNSVAESNEGNNTLFFGGPGACG
ncbi:MAG: CARDB domain-containing protein [Caldilineaceae bacterium]